MNLITKNTDYTIRALLYMAKENKKIIAVSEIAKRIKIPYPFLRMAFQILHKKGFLYAHRGKGGGFSFKVKPEKIFVLDLIKIFQKDLKLYKCFLKKKICPEINRCKFKEVLDSIENYAYCKLKSVSIKSLLN